MFGGERLRLSALTEAHSAPLDIPGIMRPFGDNGLAKYCQCAASVTGDSIGYGRMAFMTWPSGQSFADPFKAYTVTNNSGATTAHLHFPVGLCMVAGGLAETYWAWMIMHGIVEDAVAASATYTYGQALKTVDASGNNNLSDFVEGTDAPYLCVAHSLTAGTTITAVDAFVHVPFFF